MPRGLMQRGEFALAGEASMPYGLMQPWLSLWGRHQPRLLPLRFLRNRRSEILNLALQLKRSVAADDRRSFLAHLLCVPVAACQEEAASAEGEADDQRSFPAHLLCVPVAAAC